MTDVLQKLRRARRRRFIGGLLLCLTLAAPVHAHEGHAEAEHAPVSVAPQTPRLSYQSPRIESVALIDAQGLLVWVDDFASNQPLTGLAVSARVGSRTVQAQEIEAGTYRLPLDLLGGHDQSELALSLSLRGKDWEEHYAGQLPRVRPSILAAAPVYSRFTVSVAVLIVAALAAVTCIVWRRRPRA